MSLLHPQVFLIRHGETEWSRAGRHTGATDIALTERGERQARQLVTLVQQAGFTAVLTSPLQRARQTCELAGLGDLARIEPNLREWNYGDYEGLTTNDIRAQRPGWNVYKDGCPGGESPEQVSMRADLVVAELRDGNGRVAVFSHGHFLRALAMRWVGLPILNASLFGLDTASLSILAYGPYPGDGPVIALWNAASNDAVDLAPDER